MADTVTKLQVKVRWEARDTKFVLTDTTGLSLTNTIYRRLAAIIPWPELNRVNTSASTTAKQEAVTWPSVKFIDVTNVEVQNPEDNLKYVSVVPARTELEWSVLRGNEPDFPQVYKRSYDGTQNVIEFAPAPNTGSLTVRITGQVEPVEVTDGASTTIFIGETADDVLAFLISADVMDKRNQPGRSKALVARAAEMLSAIAGREVTPAELKQDLENA